MSTTNSSSRCGSETSGVHHVDGMNSNAKKSSLNGSLEVLLTPELLFKMNKKIAQLTKVVYGLNTRGEELESQYNAVKESEEKTRAVNTDLQHRVNTFKNTIENEMGRLRELETQANQAHIWKMECENLQRRLDSVDIGKSSAGDSIALSIARDEIDQGRRRENSIQYELDQARHAITNLKAHHDFMMRERDAQQAMEKEKILLEWQTRMAELEARHKSQIRRLSEDFEVLSSECEILRGRISRAPSATDEGILRDQILALQIQNDTDRRELEMKLRKQREETENEKQRHNEEIKDLRRKTQAIKNDEIWEDRLRSKSESYEQRIRDLSEKSDVLQKVLQDQEDEFEVRLKTKVVEWKSEWELAEENLQKQIQKLKSENDKLRSESKAARFSVDKASIDNVNKIQELEEELTDCKNELEMKTKNSKVRINVVESHNAQLLQEKHSLENQLEEEKKRLNNKLKNLESFNDNVKEDLQTRLQQLKESDRILKQTNRIIEEENASIKNEKEELTIKLRDKDREWEIKLDNDVKTAEARMKLKVERIWLDKLRKSEETATYDLEKLQDSNRRKEDALKRELSVSRLAAEEAKNLNEELKKKLKLLRQSDGEKAKLIKDLENQLNDRTQKDESSLRKELSSQEQKYQQQIDDLTLNLAEKQQEVSILRNKIQEVQTSFNDEDSKQQLEIRVKELKNRIQEKETAATALRSELQDLKTEHNLIQPKMKRLEDELSEAKETIVSLRDQSTSRTNDTELEVKIKNLEDQLKKSECVKKDIQETLAEIENERNEELKIVQDALDEAAQEREELIGMFEKELKTLNSKNSEREQQMLDDFEWKLREMEKNNKKKLEDKEKQAEDQLNTVRSVVESELSESLTKIAEDRRIADEKLTEVGHLRSYEAEVIQLRGVTHEFQKALRATAREMENMKIRERILDDEIRSLKKGAQSRQNTLQRAKRQVDDEEVRQKLEKLKNEINAEWEDKLRSECSRLKIELDELHAEEKHLAVESMKVQKEQEIQTLKKSFENRQEEMTIEISRLKDSLSDKDAYYHKEMDNLRTTTDRDIWDLRMKLQKLTESSYDLKQQMEEKHKDNMERFRVDYQDRIRELEQKLERYDIQSGVDVVAQLEKEHRIQMHHVGEQHQLSMERLREELEAEKFQAVEEARVIITQHHEYIEANIKEQLEESQTNYNQTIEDLETTRQALTRKEETLRNLEDELERLAESKGDSFSTFNSSLGSNIPPATSSTSSGFSSQFSLTSSNDSQSSRNSQDRYSNSEGFLDNPDDPQKAGNGGLLGKVFGGGWFTPSKSNSRRGSTPSSSKKPYTNS